MHSPGSLARHFSNLLEDTVSDIEDIASWHTKVRWSGGDGERRMGMKTMPRTCYTRGNLQTIAVVNHS